MAKKHIVKIILTSTVNKDVRLPFEDSIKEVYTFRDSGYIDILLTYVDDKGVETVKKKRTSVGWDVGGKILKQLEKLISQYQRPSTSEGLGDWLLQVEYDDKSVSQVVGDLATYVELGKTELNKYLRTRIPAGEKYKFFNVSKDRFKDKKAEEKAALEAIRRQEEDRLRKEAAEEEARIDAAMNKYDFEYLQFKIRTDDVSSTGFINKINYFPVVFNAKVKRGELFCTASLSSLSSNDTFINFNDIAEKWLDTLESLHIENWKSSYTNGEENSWPIGIKWKLCYGSKSKGETVVNGFNAFPEEWKKLIWLMYCASQYPSLLYYYKDFILPEKPTRKDIKFAKAYASDDVSMKSCFESYDELWEEAGEFSCELGEDRELDYIISVSVDQNDYDIFGTFSDEPQNLIAVDCSTREASLAEGRVLTLAKQYLQVKLMAQRNTLPANIQEYKSRFGVQFPFINFIGLEIESVKSTIQKCLKDDHPYLKRPFEKDSFCLAFNSQKPIYFNLRAAIWHGLIAGSTGTGKSTSLKSLAQNFSRLGVPVFLTDLKERINMSFPRKENFRSKSSYDLLKAFLGQEPLLSRGSYCRYWDPSGAKGHKLRFKLAEVDVELLSEKLNLTYAGKQSLQHIFELDKRYGFGLFNFTDLMDFIKMLSHSDDVYDFPAGHLNYILTAISHLKERYGKGIFGSPCLEIEDLISFNEKGEGVINIMKASKFIKTPSLYRTFVIELLSKLNKELPRYDKNFKPQMVLFFDEAEFIFNELSKLELQWLEFLLSQLSYRGVGVFFVTSSPCNVPNELLQYLRNKIQHGCFYLDNKTKKYLNFFFKNGKHDNPANKVMGLGSGQVLLSLVNEDGTICEISDAQIFPVLSSKNPPENWSYTEWKRNDLTQFYKYDADIEFSITEECPY